ncbi:MAG: CinA family protein [Clostridia bacterium]|nr:CinA family protein [Clostridia bacterium]
MIRLFSLKQSPSTQYLFDKLVLDCLDAQLQIGGTMDANQYNSDDIIILIGGYREWNKLQLPCELVNPIINQYLHSNIPIAQEIAQDATSYCYTPREFMPILDHNGYFALVGSYNGKHIYVLPDNLDSIKRLFENHIKPVLYKQCLIACIDYIKLFGVENCVVKSQTDALNTTDIKLNCTTNYLDTTVSIVSFDGYQEVNKYRIINAFSKRFVDRIYCSDNYTPQQVIVDLLTIKQKTVALAESVTGGMVASRIVDVPGASKVLLESAVTYTDIAKRNRLYVSNKDLLDYTAVSTQIAQEMARGLLQATKCDYALSVTGYADKNIDFFNGMCYICVTDREQSQTVKQYFTGDRNTVREKMTNTCLYLLINFIKNN